MKNTLKVAFAAVALIGATQAAKADLTISGATGLVLNPTAQIVAKGQPEIQANYYDHGSVWDDKSYGIVGAVQAADKLEINGGVTKWSSDADNWDKTGIALGAKYQILSQAEKGFDFAVGAGYDRALARNTYAYAAATKAFGNADRARISGTIGVRYDRFKDADSYKSKKVSAFAGVVVPVTRDGEFSLIGEVQSKNLESSYSLGEAKFPYALGVRYAPNSQPFSVTVGVQRQGINTLYERKAKLFVQANYAFGK